MALLTLASEYLPHSAVETSLRAVYDALEATFMAEGRDVPMAAAALLLRWARLLRRKCKVTESSSILTSLHRKAALLTSITRSVIYKAELLQALELTTRDGTGAHTYKIEVSGASARKGDAGWPTNAGNRPSARGRTMSAVGKVPFSASSKYTGTRSFYAAGGYDVWEKEVPCGVTTNSFIAAAYARTVHAYVSDLLPRLPSDAVLHVFELAAGPAQFAYLFCRSFLQLLEQQQIDHQDSSSQATGIRLKYIVTDFNGSLLEERRGLPWLQQLVRKGVMDFAVIDAAEDSTVGGAGGSSAPEEERQAGHLVLLSGGGRIEAGSLSGPVAVMGNYAVDTMPSDCFFSFSSQQGSGEVVKELVEDEATGRLELHEVDSQALLSSSSDQCYPYPHLLRRLLDRGPGLHIIPVGFISAINKIATLLVERPALGQRDVAILVGDGTFQWDDEHWCNEVVTTQQGKKAFIPVPDMSPSPRCFAMAVDFESLALAVASTFLLPADTAAAQGQEEEEAHEQGRLDDDGDLFRAVRSTCVDGSLTVAWMVVHPTQQAPQNSLVEFARGLCLQQPSDFELIQGLAEEGLEDVSAAGGAGAAGASSNFLTDLSGTAGLLDLLRWSCYDHDLFCTLRWRLREEVVGRRRWEQQGDSIITTGMPHYQNVIAVGMRCFLNRIALTTFGWLATRRSFLRWLYCMGAFSAVVSALINDAFMGESSSYSGDMTEALSDFIGYGSASEAFLVGKALERMGEVTMAWRVYENGAKMDTTHRMDPQGASRLKGRLEKGPPLTHRTKN